MHQGDRIPDFLGIDIDGRAWSPQQLVGEAGLVVAFLSATCPYVLAQEDRLLLLARTCGPSGVSFVAICSNTDSSLAPGNSVDDVRTHATEKGYDFPYLYDMDQTLAGLFEAACTPDLYLFDSDLRLRYRGRLDDNWREPTQVSQHFLAEEIDRMLRGADPKPIATPSFGCAIKWNPETVDRSLEGLLVASSFLRVLSHPTKTRIVNVLTGTTIQGSFDLIRFIDAFRTPTSLSEVATRLELPETACDVVRQLKETGFLVTPGTDETKPIRERVEKRKERVRSGSLLSILRMNIATGCNLRCSYCYMEAPMVNRTKTEHAAVMTEEVARRAIESFVRNAVSNGRRYVSIRYIGGEPLLNREVLVFAMRFAEQFCADNGVGVTHLVCTNGLLVDRAFTDVLKEFEDAHVLISLDGVREVNDSVRIGVNGEGTHDAVIDSIRLLLDEGMPMGVPAVVGEDGLGRVKEFMDELNDLGVERVGLNPSYRFSEDGTSEAEIDGLVADFFEARSYALSLGLQLSGKAYLPEWHSLHGHLANCEAMGRAIVVDPDGSIALCDKLDEAIGHIDNLQAIFQTDNYQRFAMRVRGEIESCFDCEAKWVCNGGCLAEARGSNGTDYLSGSHCDFIRKMAARLLVPLDEHPANHIDDR